MTSYFGFSIGNRVTSGGSSLGTVVDPGCELSDEMLDRRCVPVAWDSDKGTGIISWTMSANLRTVDSVR